MRLQPSERQHPLSVTLAWFTAVWAALQLVLGVLPSSPMGHDHPMDAEAWGTTFDLNAEVYDEGDARDADDELSEEEDDENPVGPSSRRLDVFRRGMPIVERETATRAAARVAALDLTRAARGPPAA